MKANRTLSYISLSAYHEEEPFAVRIIKSGWSGPQLYHVITEYGDIEVAEYKGTMTGEQIKETYNIDTTPIDGCLNLYVDALPNDQDLGRQIREIIK